MKNIYSDTTIKSTKFFSKIFLLITFLLLSTTTMMGQKEKQHISLRDSIDGAIDLSDYIIYAHGFLVIPTVITEPALGGIGGAVAPIFLKKHEPFTDKDGKTRIINPDITGGFGMYTGNDSWMVAAFRSATLAKSRIMYRVMGGYGDINMSFYDNLSLILKWLFFIRKY